MSKKVKVKKKKKKVKGTRGEGVERVEKKEVRVEEGAATGMSEDIEAWWKEFDDSDMDAKLGLLYNAFAREEKEEFWEGLDLFYAVDKVFNDLASNGRVEEGIKLLEKLKEQRPAQYMHDCPYYDSYQLYYYAPLGDQMRIKEIIENFERDPAKGIDHLAVTLDIFRLYGMARETYQLSRSAYLKLKGSADIMPWGVDELDQRAIFCAIRDYITSSNYGEEEAEEVFFRELKALDFWDDEPGTMDDEWLQKTMKTLRGELRREWNREDFISTNADCEENVYFLVFEFIRYLHIAKSFEWVTGELFFELVIEYFAGVPKREDGFLFSFSKDYLDKYLASFFDFLSLNDTRGMVVLIAMEYFASFLHEKGIFTDDELKEVEDAIEEFNVPLRDIYEKRSWKYKFLERWGFWS